MNDTAETVRPLPVSFEQAILDEAYADFEYDVKHFAEGRLFAEWYAEYLECARVNHVAGGLPLRECLCCD